MGYVLLEAGLASLPAVGTRVGGIPEIIEEGANGLLAPAKNPSALASAIAKLAASPELRKKFGDKNREIVKTKFSFEKMRAATLALY